MKEYKHTQTGYFLISALGAATLMIAYLTVLTKFSLGTILLLVIMILCLGVFATLSVAVDDQAIKIQFGIGLIRKHFPLKAIQAYHTVKNPWYYGWGIHAIPGGWIFNVSGWEAIELQMKDGRKYRIGTDDLYGFAHALEAYMSRPQS